MVRAGGAVHIWGGGFLSVILGAKAGGDFEESPFSHKKLGCDGEGPCWYSSLYVWRNPEGTLLPVGKGSHWFLEARPSDEASLCHGQEHFCLVQAVEPQLSKMRV